MRDCAVCAIGTSYLFHDAVVMGNARPWWGALLLVLLTFVAHCQSAIKFEATATSGRELLNAVLQLGLAAIRARNGSSASSDEYILRIKGTVNITGIIPRNTTPTLDLELQGTFMVAGDSAQNSMIDFAASAGLVETVSRVDRARHQAMHVHGSCTCMVETCQHAQPSPTAGMPGRPCS